MVFSMSENTAPERRVCNFLRRRGYRLEKHVRSLPGTPDIVLPDFSIVIFVHGCFWHHHHCGRGKTPRSNRQGWKDDFKRKEERDAENFEKLERLGWRVIVIWECETRSPKRLAELLTFL